MTPKMPDLAAQSASYTHRSINTNYNGKTFYFCMKDRNEIFEKHTDAYERLVAEDAH